MEKIEAARVTTALIGLSLFVMVGVLNWCWLCLGLLRKLTKSSERVPAMVFAIGPRVAYFECVVLRLASALRPFAGVALRPPG